MGRLDELRALLAKDAPFQNEADMEVGYVLINPSDLALLLEIADEATESRDDNGKNRCRICDASWPHKGHDDWCPIPKLGRKP